MNDNATPEAPRPSVAPWEFELFVDLEVEGVATPEQLATLEADRHRWRSVLVQLVRAGEQHLVAARRLTGPERAQVVADAEADHERLTAAWSRFTGVPLPEATTRPAEATRGSRGPAATPVTLDVDAEVPARVRLQVSWEPGRVVAWAGGPRCTPADAATVVEALAAADAPTGPWAPYGSVPLPGGQRAEAVSAPVGEVLGWLVAAGAGQIGVEVGASTDWLGRVATWAVELVALGSVVPLLRQRRRRNNAQASRSNSASYSVRWTPALIDPTRLSGFVEAMPGSVLALDPAVDARALTRSALTGMVDAICRDSARRVEVPAPPPVVRTASDVTEAFLGRLDGSAFDAPTKVAGDLVARAEEWARAVTHEHAPIVVRLEAPARPLDGWDLAVFAAPPKGGLIPIERAIVDARSERADLEQEIARVERMVPALRRPGVDRRGHTIVTQDEAWEIMCEIGPRLAAAGFDVRVPALSLHKPRPSLRVFAEESGTAVGAHQLADVRWSAVFDDVELTAADIARLAKEARPLIHTGGRWVALDQADLAAAAAALAERADRTRLSGADMLRLALGLEGSPLAGGISVEGGGWAADLLAAAEDLAEGEIGTPTGFVGELRSYQAEALGWLGFLASAGIGGCLALDMGLGKTPTMLAHLQGAVHRGPALVIAPPAVVGNWASEAGQFTPSLRVVVHHGAGRAAADELADELAEADVLITTYGTAVRDVEALAEFDWGSLVLDEAQAIKNPTSETAQQLRRIGARTRVALTGTPIENGLGDLWAILDFTNPGLVGPRPQFVAALSADGDSATASAEHALRALNGILVFRRTKSEPAIAAELPDRIDELDRCAMTPEQIGLYQAVLDRLVLAADLPEGEEPRQGQILAAITALKQICNHPAAYQDDGRPLAGRSGKLARLEEIVDTVYAAGERVLIFTHFAEWGLKLAAHLTAHTDTAVDCYHGGLSRGVRDRMIEDFQNGEGPGALVLSLKAGGTGLNLTAANHVVLYDRWWNPAVEDQARDRAWRIGQTHTVICHRLVCPGTVDERVEEVVEGKRRIADLVLPKSSSLADLDHTQLSQALGIRPDAVLAEDADDAPPTTGAAA
ncbi:MAG: SNF2-related protein [Actinomycetes bacterium]